MSILVSAVRAMGMEKGVRAEEHGMDDRGLWAAIE